MRKTLGLLAALLLSAATLLATTLTCSIDSLGLIWTGRTKVDRMTSQMLYEHKCINNHYFWLTSEQMNR